MRRCPHLLELRRCRGGSYSSDKVARSNLRVKLSDLITVHQCLDIKYGKLVHILPFDDSIEGLSRTIFNVYLKPYFFEGDLAFPCWVPIY